MTTAAPPAPGPTAPVSSPGPAPAGATERSRRVSPAARDVVTDVVGLGVLGVVALSGLGPAFGGLRYLVVGAVGLALGLALALVGALRRAPLWAVALVVVVVGVVVGACLVQPDAAVALVVPSADSVRDVVQGAFQGWVNLLTTTVPVGAAQNLLVVPWAAGLVAGATAMSASRRAASGGRALLALLPMAALLVGGLLMGVDAPAWPLQATAFALVALVWGSARQRSARSAGMAASRRPRLVSAVAVLAVTGALGLVVGRSSLVGGTEDRVVLRDHVEPPIDLRSLPSPLEGFRRYLDGDRRDEVLFTVEGLEEGDRLRLATLDGYDGTIWHVTGGVEGAESSSVFQRVGQQLPVTETGERRTVTVEVGDYADAWLPTLGATERISFSGGRAAELSEGFRYNLSTDTAAEPEGLRAGDRYVLDAVVPDPHADLDRGAAQPGVTVPAPESVEAVGIRLGLLSPDASASPLTRAREVEGHLSGRLDGTVDGTGRGYFSDGDLDPRDDAPPSRPGHSAERMRALLEVGNPMVGDEEQFASAMALLAHELGLPSRVVMGFSPGTRSSDTDGGAGTDPSGDEGAVEVTGADVSAWTEVAVEGVGWIPLLPTPTDRETPPTDEKTKVPPPDRFVPPPPVTVPRVPVPRRGSDAPTACVADCQDDEGGPLAGIPAWVEAGAKVVLPPVLLLGGLTLVMAGLKGRRRRRRRRHGSPAERVAGGWADVCDLARDLGDIVPERATRRETAVLVGRPGTADLARSADALVFGPSAVDPVVAEAYWEEVDATRAALLATLSPLGRWRVLVSPRSLGRRRPSGTDRGGPRSSAPGG